MLEVYFKHSVTFFDFSIDFRRLPKISDDFQRLSEDFQKYRKFVGLIVFALSGFFFLSFPKNFQTLNKGDRYFFHVCY